MREFLSQPIWTMIQVSICTWYCYCGYKRIL